MMKTITVFLLALLFCYQANAQEARLQEDLNGCNANCLFTECMVSCEKGTYPACSCLLGSFASCECRVKSTTVPAQHLPKLKNTGKLQESIDRLKEGGFEDYARLFDQLRFSIEVKDVTVYYKYLSALDELVNKEPERALQAYKLIIR